MPRMHCPSCGEEVTVKSSSLFGSCWSCGEQFPIDEDSPDAEGLSERQEGKFAADDTPEEET